MKPRFQFKDYVIINSDINFWGKIKGQIIDYEEKAQMGNMGKITQEYKYLVKIKKSSVTKWFYEDELTLRNEEVNPELIGDSYE